MLIVGSGGREHALASKLRQSADVGALFVAPGNAGTAEVAENVSVSATDVGRLARFVEERDIDLTVIGPEAPLALGLADRLRTCGRRVVGPSAAAARLESSKSFAKDVMRRAGVPTAGYATFDDPKSALAYIAGGDYPVVIKADGLAAGKGVAICSNPNEAADAVTGAMVDGIHGSAGSRVIVEEFLSGPELSLLALVDGQRVIPLPVAQDHKRLCDGDLGPNTGGMGAYAPVPFLANEERDALCRSLLEPVIWSLAEAGIPYRGILFAGVVLTAAGPRVLEFNCRFGDPEAQVILPLVDGDLLPWLNAVADGRLEGPLTVLRRNAVGVVLAARGYPHIPQIGTRVEAACEASTDTLLFHGGTARDGAGRIITSGGRVFTVVGLGETVEEAARRAYGVPIRFEGMQRRGDIAWQALQPNTFPVIEKSRGQRQGSGSQAGIAVLASGDGSNLQAVLDACLRREIDASVAVVLSNEPQARALERARQAGVPAVALPLQDRRDPVVRGLWEERILAVLQAFDLDLIVLAGWMLVFSGEFLARCRCPLINVHPALLPSPGSDSGPGKMEESTPPPGFPVLRGVRAVRDAIGSGLPYTGVTVHLVTPEVDAGPVLLRESVPIEPGDDEMSLHARIKAVEHRLLPRGIQTILQPIATGGAHA